MITKQKKVSPFATKTLKRTRVNGVKIMLQTLRKKVWGNSLKWFVKTSDGTNKTLFTEEEAIEYMSKVINFEKRQLSIND